jgi:DNA replicative helicase MCM subunit Mcm2 (Cdc46/Mcm family)
MGELVDHVKPGDRVQVNGVFKCLVSGKTMFSGVFSTKLVATGIDHLKEEDL